MVYTPYFSFPRSIFEGYLYPFVLLGALVITVVIFMINALQFGMDQLHGSPTEDSILFVHWYVWIYYAGSFLTALAWNLLVTDTHHIYVGALFYAGSSLIVLFFAGSLVLLIF